MMPVVQWKYHDNSHEIIVEIICAAGKGYLGYQGVAWMIGVIRVIPMAKEHNNIMTTVTCVL
jgi:hypothetical protein